MYEEVIKTIDKIMNKIYSRSINFKYVYDKEGNFLRKEYDKETEKLLNDLNILKIKYTMMGKEVRKG